MWAAKLTQGLAALAASLPDAAAGAGSPACSILTSGKHASHQATSLSVSQQLGSPVAGDLLQEVTEATQYAAQQQPRRLADKTEAR